VGFRDRIARAGMFPNMGEIRGELDAKFDELVTELRAIRAVLDAILAEAMKQGPGA
jgi:hypothetical protein